MTVECQVCLGNTCTPAGEKSGYRLYRCSDCRFQFVHPMPDEQTLADFYKNYRKNERYSSKADGKLRRAKRRIGRIRRLAPGSRFLDVGCNVGSAVEAARLHGFNPCYGIDIDPESIELAQNLYPLNDFRVCYVEQLLEANDKFDMIYCTEVLEHVPDANDFMDALRRLLKQSGILYLTTPDADHYSVRKKGVDWGGIRPPEHLLYFGRRSVRKLMEKHGFKVRSIAWTLKPDLKLVARAV